MERRVRRAALPEKLSAVALPHPSTTGRNAVRCFHHTLLVVTSSIYLRVRGCSSIRRRKELVIATIADHRISY